MKPQRFQRARDRLRLLRFLGPLLGLDVHFHEEGRSRSEGRERRGLSRTHQRTEVIHAAELVFHAATRLERTREIGEEIEARRRRFGGGVTARRGRTLSGPFATFARGERQHHEPDEKAKERAIERAILKEAPPFARQVETRGVHSDAKSTDIAAHDRYPFSSVGAPQRFGPFYLDARIAVGGTAEVYLARPQQAAPQFPARLVVKRLLPHFAADAQGRTMFDREARLHAAVQHENVVTVYGAGHDDGGEPYLAMEFIDGVDGYRLLRRLRQEAELLPIGVAIYIAREVLRALESVHAAKDPVSGSPGIVHRDVSPSNIYLSKEGGVKLGDFGIARGAMRPTLKTDQGHILKGKFAYLAPEQVAGEPSDQRADLFSLAAVLAEMLLNRPLFPGGGQLAVLLAIRDCKIGALNEIANRLPPGLLEVMQRALARSPEARYASAAELGAALTPFQADARLAQREIAARVRWVQAAGSSDKVGAQRDAAKRGSAGMRAVVVRPVVPPKPRESVPPKTDGQEAKTSEYGYLPSRVLRGDGTELGPWTFARLMEALATGQIQRDDRVDFVGRGYRPAHEIDELARFFPAADPTTNNVHGPGKPDFRDAIGPGTMLETLIRVFRGRETGVLFVERAEPDHPGRPSAGPPSRSSRKELYFVEGKLHHVASSNAHELLGEYLVRRKKLERAELDLALAVLPRYGGRMGDTLISLGLVGPVDIFRAIREQGRDRVADLFLWRGGQLAFYRGQTASRVEFPLDLELPALMLAGLETARHAEALIEEYRASSDCELTPVHTNAFAAVTWPPLVASVLELAARPSTLRELIAAAAQGDAPLTAPEVLRAFEILLAAGLVRWK
jgi:eukaryotic-like serine/threonine-protein kinase